ncbi:MAG: UDP-3-O-[3-hydroxymyristoyl] N-acetylglucosamine deacetylase [Synergistaceae bacterium]|nr:UDP-3-O-[3-hydroxymyristoyl] N-acetylglucosamine deacetylase [Synergistaceae bacterium]
MRRRRTLAGPVSFEGVGLHYGQPARVVVSPYEGQGYLFVCGDERSPVEGLQLESGERGTALVFPGGGRVQTVEHLCAALRGLELDDVIVTFDGPEPPVLDGGAVLYGRRLMEIGIVEKDAACEACSVTVPIIIESGDRLVAALPAENFRLSYVIDYDHPLIGTRRLSLAMTPAAFMAQIAPARTFCLERDLEAIKARGLAQGGTLENAVVVGDKGVLNPDGLRYDDEYVRHKILDFLGDLALLGRPLRGHFLAIAAGHDLHQALVERIRPFVLKGRID